MINLKVFTMHESSQNTSMIDNSSQNRIEQKNIYIRTNKIHYLRNSIFPHIKTKLALQLGT